jgi:hypothetical protein
LLRHHSISLLVLPTTAHSTAETEYYSASAAGCEVLYLSAVLDSFGFKQKRTILIYEDNTACIERGNNVISGRERTKHMDIWKHFADEVIQHGQMRLVKVPTAQQMADILAKGLHLPQDTACVDGLLGRKSNPSIEGTSVLMRGYGVCCVTAISTRRLESGAIRDPGLGSWRQGKWRRQWNVPLRAGLYLRHKK